MQITALTLNNGSATPTAFDVVMPQNGDTPARWAATAVSTVALGRPNLTARVFRSATANKARLQVAVPRVNADGALVHKVLMTTELVMPDSATQAEIDDCYAYMYAALTQTIVSASVRQGQQIF